MINVQVDDIVERLTEGEVWFCQRLSPAHLAIYRTLRKRLDDYLLDFLAMNIRYFTSHGKKHSLGVIRQMHLLLRDLPTDVLMQITSVEYLVLLCSAWLHDIGLLVNKNGTGQPLSDAEIRKLHHQLSHDKILEIHGEAGIDNPNLARLIARVCLCHRRSISIEEQLPAEQFIQGECVRPRLLAALLRLGDALDTDWGRAPQVFLEKLTDLPDTARLHWQACQMLEIGYRPAREDIYLDATYRPESGLSEDEARRLFLWKFDDLSGELNGVHSIVRAYGLPYERLTGRLDLPSGAMQLGSDSPLPEEVWPLEVILYDRYRRVHEARGEYIFAADWCFQAGRIYEKKDRKKTAEWYTKATQLAEREHKEGTYSPYWWRILETYFPLKTHQMLNDIDLSHEEEKLIQDVDYIQYQLNLVEADLGSVYRHRRLETLHVLLKMGHSPLRESIAALIRQLQEEAELDGTIDESCPYCTGIWVSILSLCRDKGRLSKSLTWLRAQKNNEWRYYKGQQVGLSNTACALIGLTDSVEDLAHNPELREALTLLQTKDWRTYRDTFRLESDRLIIYALATCLLRLRLESKNAEEALLPLNKMVGDFMQYLIEDFDQFIEKNFNIRQVASGLLGIAPAIAMGGQTTQRALQCFEHMRSFFLGGGRWIKSDEQLATNPETSMYWLWGWISAWDYELLRLDEERCEE